ncbi:hypothetical protein [Peribacillus aracenensis]|nr:hypothetical protein [Peribacillus sp. BBB004]
MSKLIPNTKENKIIAKKLAEKEKTLNDIKSMKPVKYKKSHK